MFTLPPVVNSQNSFTQMHVIINAQLIYPLLQSLNVSPGHPGNSSSLLDGTSDSLGSVATASAGRERARTTHNDTGMGSSINESPGSPRYHHEDRYTPTSLTGSPHRGTCTVVSYFVLLYTVEPKKRIGVTVSENSQ